MKAQIGKLRLHACHSGSHGEHAGNTGTKDQYGYEFWCADGTILDIEITDLLSEIPLEIPIEVFLEGNEIIRWRRDTSQPEAYRDKTRKDIALVAAIEEGDEENRRDYIWKMVQASAVELETFFRWIARENWKVDVTPYIIVVPDKSRLGISGDWNLVKELVGEQAPDNQHNYWHLTNAPASGYAGVAYVNGDIAVTGGVSNTKTMKHEQGHNFGLGHHNSGENFENEYGGYSRMGSAGWSFAAANQHYLRLIEEENALVIPDNQSRTVFLTLPETHPQAIWGDEKKVVYHKGYSYALHRQGTVMVDKTRTVPPSAVSVVGKMQQPGDTAKDAKFMQYKNGIAELRFGNAASEPFPELQLPNDAPSFVGKTALWHHRAWTHQGFDLYVLEEGKRAVGYWYTWTEDGPCYIVCDGPIENGIAKFKMHTPQPGNYRKVLIECGEAWMYFYDDDHGVLHYVLDDLAVGDMLTGKGTIQLKRGTTKQKHHAYGLYEFEGREYEGLSVTVNKIHNDPRFVALIWYGFEHEGTSRIRTNWKAAYGTAGEPLTVYQPKNGAPNTRTNSYLEEIGTCILRRKSFKFIDTEGKETAYKTIRLVEDDMLS